MKIKIKILDLSILAARQDMNYAITTCNVLVGENEKSGYCHHRIVLLTKNYKLIIINKESIYS